MKLQNINTPRGTRWVLLDKDFVPVNEVNSYLGNLDAKHYSPYTIKTYAHALLCYCRYLEERGLTVTDIGKTTGTAPVVLLSDFMAATQFPPATKEGNVLYIRSGEPRISDGRMNNIMSAVIGFYRYAARAGLLTDSISDLYHETGFRDQFQSFLSELTGGRKRVASELTIKTAKKAPKFITRETYCKLFEACNSLRDKLLVALLFECGLRIGEALGIHLEDLDDIESGTLKIVPRDNNENGARVKYRAAGEVYLPTYVVRLLVDYLNSQEGAFVRDYLFVVLRGPSAGRPMAPCNANKLFKRLSKDLGENVHPHMLRHGFATEKIEAGWDEREISLYLRHSHVSSTRVYEHFTERMMEERLRPFLNVSTPYERALA